MINTRKTLSILGLGLAVLAVGSTAQPASAASLPRPAHFGSTVLRDHDSDHRRDVRREEENRRREEMRRQEWLRSHRHEFRQDHGQDFRDTRRDWHQANRDRHDDHRDQRQDNNDWHRDH